MSIAGSFLHTYILKNRRIASGVSDPDVQRVDTPQRHFSDRLVFHFLLLSYWVCDVLRSERINNYLE